MAAKTTATAVTATSLALNTPLAVSYKLAENTGTDGTTDTEFFEIAVTQAEPRGVILIQNFNTTATSTLRYTVVAPTGSNKYWAAGSNIAEGILCSTCNC